MHDIGLVIAILCFLSLVLGFVLGLAVASRRKENAKYDGSLDVSATDASQIYTLSIEIEPDELQHKESVTFRVRKISDS